MGAGGGHRQVALHADLHFALGTQTDRIHNGPAEVGRIRPAAGNQLQVPGAGTVAALAVDPRRQFPGETAVEPKPVRGFRKGRIGVVAEHAGMGHLPAETLMVGPVVAGTHGPALLLGIPARRQLPQHAAGVQMEIAAGVDSRADDVGGLHLEDILLAALGIQLVAPLVEPPVALNHPVVAVGELMVEVVVDLVVLDDVLCRGYIEGAAHGDLLITVMDVGVTGLTGLRFDIPGGGIRLRSLRDSVLPCQDSPGNYRGERPE